MHFPNEAIIKTNSSIVSTHFNLLIIWHLLTFSFISGHITSTAAHCMGVGGMGQSFCLNVGCGHPVAAGAQVSPTWHPLKLKFIDMMLRLKI